MSTSQCNFWHATFVFGAFVTHFSHTFFTHFLTHFVSIFPVPGLRCQYPDVLHWSGLQPSLPWPSSPTSAACLSTPPKCRHVHNDTTTTIAITDIAIATTDINMSAQDLVVEGDGVVSGAALVSKNETSGEVLLQSMYSYKEILVKIF